MKQIFLILGIVLFGACSKQTELVAKPGRGGVNVRIDQINFALSDQPINASYFSIFLDNVQKQANFSTKHTETQSIATFTAISGQTIHLNIDSAKALQLGYVPTFRVICDLDTAIVFLNDTTSVLVP